MGTESRFIKNNLRDWRTDDQWTHPTEEDIEAIRTRMNQFVHLIETRAPPNSRECEDYTVYTGDTGIAYMFYYLYKLSLKSPNTQSEVSNQYFTKALAYARFVETQISDRLPNSDDDEEEKKRPIRCRKATFLEGNISVVALLAVLYDISGEHQKSTKMIRRIQSYIARVGDWDSNEMLYGRAGFLFTLLFVNDHFGRDMFPTSSSTSITETLASRIITDGKRLSKGSHCPLMWSWHDSEYLGGAHGVAGIIYQLLEVSALREAQTPESAQALSDILVTVDWMRQLQMPDSGNFPSREENVRDRLVQWCHGAPGIVPTLAKVHSLLPQLQSTTNLSNRFREQLLLSCERAADCIWKRGLLTKGFGLCHGISGNAFSFLYIYRETSNRKYLYRALQFARFIVSNQYSELLNAPDNPLSLFEGIAGAVCFLCNLLLILENHQSSVIPVFFPAMDLIH